jgi:hypothetical protein
MRLAARISLHDLVRENLLDDRRLLKRKYAERVHMLKGSVRWPIPLEHAALLIHDARRPAFCPADGKSMGYGAVLAEMTLKTLLDTSM